MKTLLRRPRLVVVVFVVATLLMLIGCVAVFPEYIRYVRLARSGQPQNLSEIPIGLWITAFAFYPCYPMSGRLLGQLWRGKGQLTTPFDVWLFRFYVAVIAIGWTTIGIRMLT